MDPHPFDSLPRPCAGAFLFGGVLADHITAADGEFAMANRDNHSVRWRISFVAFG
jgi:hypothetical protein